MGVQDEWGTAVRVHRTARMPPPPPHSRCKGRSPGSGPGPREVRTTGATIVTPYRIALHQRGRRTMRAISLSAPRAAPRARTATPPRGGPQVTPTGEPPDPAGGAWYFAPATLYLTAGSIALVAVAPELASGLYASPRVAATTHLLTLGWITLSIFGALNQILPVALEVPLASRWLAHATLAGLAPGAGLFAAGIASGSTSLQHAGIALVSFAIITGIGNVAVTLARSRTRDVTWTAMALAIAFLGSTLVLGVALLHNLHTGFIAAARLRYLAAHIHVALVGWALVMIVGVSHRLLPMFLVAHGARTHWSARSVAALATGTVLLAAGLLANLAPMTLAGVASLVGGVAMFAIQALAFFRARVRRSLDPGMHFIAAAIVLMTLAAPIGAVLAAAPARSGRLATTYVFTALAAGVTTYIMGAYYKIIPLLAWLAGQRHAGPAARVRTAAELSSPRAAHAQLALTLAGVATTIAGISAGSTQVTRAGAASFAAGAGLFTVNMALIALRARG